MHELLSACAIVAEATLDQATPLGPPIHRLYLDRLGTKGAGVQRALWRSGNRSADAAPLQGHKSGHGHSGENTKIRVTMH